MFVSVCAPHISHQDKYTPLHRVIEGDHTEVCSILIGAGANVNSLDYVSSLRNVTEPMLSVLFESFLLSFCRRQIVDCLMFELSNV
jgi:ankyrin repeat protein